VNNAIFFKEQHSCSTFKLNVCGLLFYMQPHILIFLPYYMRHAVTVFTVPISACQPHPSSACHGGWHRLA